MPDERPPQFRNYEQAKEKEAEVNEVVGQLIYWIDRQLVQGHSQATVAAALIEQGLVSDAQTAGRLVTQVAEQRVAQAQALKVEARNDRIGALLGSSFVALALLAWVAFNNVRAFDMGREGCVWGEPTETQCGIEVVGTGKGKLFAFVMYYPGYQLGKLFAPDEPSGNSRSTSQSSTPSTRPSGQTAAPIPTPTPTYLPRVAKISSLRQGDCFTAPGVGGASVSEVTLVECTSHWTYRALKTFNVTGVSYPGVATFDTQADANCPAETDVFFYPTSASWAGGDRQILCVEEP